MSQAVLQDIFWYTFLDKFQPNALSQQKLFNRTAHNYVKLIFYAKSAHFRDTFLKDYPLLISQAVYACFCHCFPDSYRQFGEIFKNDLVYLVYGWMAGLRPSPRCWLEWNMDGLEPANIKMREELMNRHKKRQAQAMTVNFDYLDSLVSSNPSQYPSTLSLDVSKSSMGSTRKISKRPRNHKISKRSYSPETLSQDSNVIDTVASAQPSPKKGGDGGLDSHRSTQDGETQRRTKAEGGGDGLSPIRELASEEGTVSGEEKKLSQYSPSVTRKPPTVKKLRSHPACKGPDYLKTAFNIHGRSPLVSHFLRMRNITTDANVVTRMQRTELDNLPPLDAKTYSDVVRESSKTVKSIEKYFQESYGRHQKEVSLFLNQQAAEMTEYRKRENLLLSKKPEVHRLSDLIILEQKKGVGSISAGASQAVVAALMSMDP